MTTAINPILVACIMIIITVMTATIIAFIAS
jgi:hypothetical protein